MKGYSISFAVINIYNSASYHFSSDHNTEDHSIITANSRNILPDVYTFMSFIMNSIEYTFAHSTKLTPNNIASNIHPICYVMSFVCLILSIMN